MSRLTTESITMSRKPGFHGPMGLIPFVKARDDSKLENSPRNKMNNSAPDYEIVVAGRETKSFYDKLIQPKNSLQAQSQRLESNKRRVRRHDNDTTHVHNDLKLKRRCHTLVTHSSSREKSIGKLKKPTDQKFLQAAQEGDIKTLEAYISEGQNINTCDPFGWTALMCASCSGQSKAAKFLLDKGADVFFLNHQGQSARDIALASKHENIAHLLGSKKTKNTSPQLQTQNVLSFYCKVCETFIFNVSEKAHSTSTLHLFNCKLPPKGTTYGLPESNKGFQMMLQKGWDKEKGLGSKEQGKKFPVKTVLKRDRFGLGSKVKDKSKVTHFNAKDTDSVKSITSDRTMRATTLCKRRKSRQQAKQKAKEKAFRREFYVE